MDWKKLGRKLLFPPAWLLLLLTVLCAGGLAVVFIRSRQEQPIAIIVYILSFYTLSVGTLYGIFVFPGQYRSIKKRLYDHPLGNRYLTDRAYRAKISLHICLLINLLYALLHLGAWYFLRSNWFLIFAVYYLVLALMRYLLVGYVRFHALGASVLSEWKRARLCACILLLINLFLSGAVLMILYRDRGCHYPGILIYVMALYTFYAAIHAIIYTIRYRSWKSPVMSTAKIISLAAALVSMLNLETAMFAQFGKEMSTFHQNLFIILTGAGVSILVVTLCVTVIVKATKEIRRKQYGI